eukprot:12895729-Prorocentrum_lima.AAC.1
MNLEMQACRMNAESCVAPLKQEVAGAANIGESTGYEKMRCKLAEVIAEKDKHVARLRSKMRAADAIGAAAP